MSQDDKTVGELPELEALEFEHPGNGTTFLAIVAVGDEDLTNEQTAAVIHWAKVGPKMREALERAGGELNFAYPPETSAIVGTRIDKALACIRAALAESPSNEKGA